MLTSFEFFSVLRAISFTFDLSLEAWESLCERQPWTIHNLATESESFGAPESEVFPGSATWYRYRPLPRDAWLEVLGIGILENEDGHAALELRRHFEKEIGVAMPLGLSYDPDEDPGHGLSVMATGWEDFQGSSERVYYLPVWMTESLETETVFRALDCAGADFMDEFAFRDRASSLLCAGVAVTLQCRHVWHRPFLATVD